MRSSISLQLGTLAFLLVTWIYSTRVITLRHVTAVSMINNKDEIELVYTCMNTVCSYILVVFSDSAHSAGSFRFPVKSGRPMNFPLWLHCTEKYLNSNIWRAFVKLRKAALIFVVSLRPSVHLFACNKSTLTGGFSWGLTSDDFSKMCRENLSVIGMWQV